MSQDNLKVSESKEIKDNYQAVQTEKKSIIHQGCCRNATALDYCDIEWFALETNKVHFFHF